MLSIWKLVRSSSISGLSWMTNPNRPKISAISSIATMLGCSVPLRIGLPGVVTSCVSSASRWVSAEPRSSVPRSARAVSMAPRTALATAPTRGRSSAGSPPIPRRTVVSRPFLPRTSSSRASSAATSRVEPIAARVSSRSVSRSRVSWARSTSVLPCQATESGALERRRRRGPGGGRGRQPAGPVSDALGEVGDLAERGRVADREVGQDLAVDLDVSLLQARDELPVGDPILAGRGVDADDPELSHLALALLPVAGRVGHRVQQCLASRLDQARLRALAALRVLHEALVAFVGRDAPL